MKSPVWMRVVGIVAFAFMLLPVALVIWLSFYRNAMMTFPPTGYTLRWYGEMLNQKDLFTGLFYSLEVSVIATVSRWSSESWRRSASIARG